MAMARVLIPDGPIEAETKLESLTDEQIVGMIFASLPRERADAVAVKFAKRAGLPTTMQGYLLAVCSHRASPEQEPVMMGNSH